MLCCEVVKWAQVVCCCDVVCVGYFGQVFDVVYVDFYGDLMGVFDCIYVFIGMDIFDQICVGFVWWIEVKFELVCGVYCYDIVDYGMIEVQVCEFFGDYVECFDLVEKW